MVPRSFAAVLVCLFLAGIAFTAAGQSCPTGTAPEIRYKGLNCDATGRYASWEPCSLSAPVTFILYNHDTGQPYQLQSCENSVDWSFPDGTTAQGAGVTIQHTFTTSSDRLATAVVNYDGRSVRSCKSAQVPVANGYISNTLRKSFVSEGDGYAYVYLHTTYAPVTVSYVALNDQNADGRFNPTPGTVSFAAGEFDKILAIPIIDDAKWEGNGSFYVKFTNPTNDVVLPVFATASYTSPFTITDNDLPTFSWAQPSYAFSENSVKPQLTIVRTGDPSLAAEVNFAVHTSSGAVVTQGTLPFDSGETSKPVDLPVVNDDLWSPDRRWTADLTGESLFATLGKLTKTAVTIVDDDPMPTLSINDRSVVEGNTGHLDVVFTVTLSDPISSPVFVALSYGGSATAGTDYLTPPTFVLFQPGETKKSFVITVNGDTAVEPDETVTVTMTSTIDGAPAPAYLKRTGTLTIIDDDGPKPGAAVIATEVAPSTGLVAGGTVVGIAGGNFTPSCSVSFGGTPATTVFESATSLEVTTPAHAAGATDVTITCGTDQFTLPNGFTFFAPARSRGVRH